MHLSVGCINHYFNRPFQVELYYSGATQVKKNFPSKTAYGLEWHFTHRHKMFCSKKRDESFSFRRWVCRRDRNFRQVKFNWNCCGVILLYIVLLWFRYIMLTTSTEKLNFSLVVTKFTIWTSFVTQDQYTGCVHSVAVDIMQKKYPRLSYSVWGRFLTDVEFVKPLAYNYKSSNKFKLFVQLNPWRTDTKSLKWEVTAWAGFF